VLESVAHAELRIIGNWEAKPQIAASVALPERSDVAKVDLLVEKVEARREIAIEEVRLGEAEVELRPLEASREPEPDILPLTHQIALGNADVADHALARGVAGAERELAGRLLLHLDNEDDTVGGAAGFRLDFDRFKKSECAQPLACGLDKQPIERIAFRHPELASDHLILGAEIADNVDALDVDAGALFDDVGDVYRAGGRIAIEARPYLAEGIALL
jgi:hypothetical protein